MYSTNDEGGRRKKDELGEAPVADEQHVEHESVMVRVEKVCVD